MSIEGRIAIDVGFTDTYTASSMTSVQRITFTNTDTYASGKVAVITGTCGTSAVSISIAPTSYRDAGGSLVSFADVARVAFQASRECTYEDGFNTLRSQVAAVFSPVDEPSISISVTGSAGTASYTLVLYGI
jgi:hypothetical protein